MQIRNDTKDTAECRYLAIYMGKLHNPFTYTQAVHLTHNFTRRSYFLSPTTPHRTMRPPHSLYKAEDYRPYPLQIGMVPSSTQSQSFLHLTKG